MNKLVTKPYSRIDESILIVMDSIIFYHFISWILYQFRIFDRFLLVIIPIIIAFGVVIFLFTIYLYCNVYSKEKKLSRLKKKVFNYLYIHYKSINESKVIRLIYDICNATIVPIEDRKPLYDEVVKYLIECFPDGEKVQPLIAKRWKMAVIEYKKYEILND